MIDIRVQGKPSLSSYARLREIHLTSLLFCFVLGSVQLRPVRDTVRVLVCVTSVAITSFKLKLQIHLLVAEIKHYVRKRQLLTLFVIPPVVAARGHAPAPKALLQYLLYSCTASFKCFLGPNLPNILRFVVRLS